MLISPTAPGLRRFLGASVGALLAANAMAVVTLLGDDDEGPAGRLGDPAPASAGDAVVPQLDPTAPVLITTEDGDTYLADPTTEAGRAAIEEATREGGEVRSITAPSGPAAATRSDGATGALPTPAEQLQSLVEQLGGGTGTTPAPGGTGGATTIPGGGGGGLLPVDPSLVEDLLGDPLTTVTSLVQTAPSTVSSIVQSTPTTITATVTSLLQTVTTLPPVTTPTLPPTTVPSTGGLLGGLETTVTSVVGTVSTVAPAPTPTTCLPLVGC